MIPHSRPDLGEAEIDAVVRVLRSGRIAQGAEVEAFEHECAAFVGRRFGVAVNSGTAALHLGLAVLGVGAEEAVVFPSYACAALLQAVTWQQARPVLADIGPDYNLDPGAIPKACRAAIVPHLFGAPARIPVGLPVIEDIAQSIGGATGAASAVAVVSFYATKLLTTGEGGMLLTDNEGMAEYARDLRDYDNRDDFIVRYAYKMTDFQAALGRIQLKRLPEFIERRQTLARRYTEAFAELPVRLPNPEGHVFFRYGIALEQRDALERHLSGFGIEAKRPVYRPAHHYLGGTYPVSEQAHHENLSIPIYPAMTSQECDFVIQSILKFWR